MPEPKDGYTPKNYKPLFLKFKATGMTDKQKKHARPVFIADLPGGGGTGGISSVNGDYGPDVVLTAADVNAVRSVNGKAGQDVELNAKDVGAVREINGHTGEVVSLTASDIGAITSVNGDRGPAVSITPTSIGAVESVNGKSGQAVTITAADVGAVKTVNGKSGQTVTISGEDITGVVTSVDGKSGDISISSISSSAATPDKIILRDGESRAKIADPVDGTDIANKQYVDSKVGGVISIDGADGELESKSFGDNTAEPDTLALRTAAGGLNIVTPSSAAPNAAVNKKYLDETVIPKLKAETVTKLAGQVGDIALTDIGTKGVIANKLVLRDQAGNFEVNEPTENSHPATKKYVDDNITVPVQSVQGRTGEVVITPEDVNGSADPLPDTMIIRTDAGRAQFADPEVAADGATKKYVDDNKGVQSVNGKSDEEVVITAEELGAVKTTDAKSELTPGSVPKRDEGNQFKVGTPTDDAHVATKEYVDANKSSDHIPTKMITSVTELPITPNTEEKKFRYCFVVKGVPVKFSWVDSKFKWVLLVETNSPEIVGAVISIINDMNAHFEEKPTQSPFHEAGFMVPTDADGDGHLEVTYILTQSSGEFPYTWGEFKPIATINGEEVSHAVTLGTADATADKLIKRDDQGNAKVAEPKAASDIATKKYVDDNAGGTQFYQVGTRAAREQVTPTFGMEWRETDNGRNLFGCREDGEWYQATGAVPFSTTLDEKASRIFTVVVDLPDLELCDECHYQLDVSDLLQVQESKSGEWVQLNGKYYSSLTQRVTDNGNITQVNITFQTLSKQHWGIKGNLFWRRVLN